MTVRRPTGLDDLPFPRHPAVRWFSPGELARTAVHAAVSGVFGAYADKREVQAALPVPLYSDHSGASELWMDYVSDLGDGFDATYSVAYLLGRPKLDLADGEGGAVATPRGSLLVMGGDEVYPSATAQAYEERTRGPYRAALPEADDPPVLYAVPGNHDWYDGLTAWLRFFCQGQWFGGWRTVQRRSYFAAKLPHGWWLLGLDVQLDTYLDGPQVEYFRAVAAEIGPDDGVVLCTGKPSWVQGGRDHPEAYATLDFFLRRVLAKDPAQVRLMLSGDTHHYARYAQREDGRQLITCGGGGAYLSATHDHDQPLVLPPQALCEREVDPPPCTSYDLERTYPSAADSRRMVHGVLTGLPRRNPGFVGLLAGLQGLLAHLLVAGWAAGSGTGAGLARTWSRPPGVAETVAAVRSPLVLLVTALLVLACVAAARSGGTRRPRTVGGAHGLAHLAVAVGTVSAVARLPLPEGWAEPLTYLLRLGLAAAVGGLLSTAVVAGYLWLSARRGLHLNEVFSAQALEDGKCFLRLHLGSGGDLTVHAVAVPRVCRRWRVPPAAARDTPWVEPAEPLLARLVEPPVRVPRNPESVSTSIPRSPRP